MTGINRLCYKQGEGEGNVTNRGRPLIPLIPLNLLEIFVLQIIAKSVISKQFKFYLTVIAMQTFQVSRILRETHAI